MLQSNHRNASFVHSHIAVLQFAFFFLTKKRGAQKYMIKNSRTLRFNGKRPAELFSIVS